MASVLLQGVGSAVGNAILPGIGGAFLGSLGRAAGGLIDQKIGLGTHVTGPRLETLSVQDSRYGRAIPVIYGRARVAGNVIWSTDLIETQHNSSVGGKGGGISTTTFTYSVHCAVGLCLGPIGGIATIWADSTIIYQNGSWTSGIVDAATVYTGSASQTPDPFMQSVLGADNVPAWKNLAYIVFENLQLAHFGNRIPNLTFEIIPASNVTSPIWSGSINPALNGIGSDMACGMLTPIPLNSTTAVVGGYTPSGSNWAFTAITYDTSGSVPVEIARASSTSFPISFAYDQSWSLSPDGRFIIFYTVDDTGTRLHYFALYDTVAQQFGPVLSANLDRATPYKVMAWLDAQRFVISDIVGGALGLHVFMRSGLGLVDLGFFNIWGNGTSTTLQPYYGAQFTPYAGGLIAYVWTFGVSNPLTLTARTITWRNGTLNVGAAFTAVGGMTISTWSQICAQFIQTSAIEWTLVITSTYYTGLISFEPSANGAVITRPWQVFTNSFGLGGTNYPVFFGDRFIVIQQAYTENQYRLSEILLASGRFSQSANAVVITGSTAYSHQFGAIRLDTNRILFIAANTNNTIGQCAVINRGTSGNLATVIGDILTRAGYGTSDYDLSALSSTIIDGYVVSENHPARGTIEPLQMYTPFDLVEASGVLKAIPRGSSAAVTISSSEWRAVENYTADPPPGLDVTRGQESDLPREITLDFIDPSRNFEINSQRARRTATSSKLVQKITLPIVCEANLSKQIAEARLFTTWAERELVRISLSRRWLALDPADIIDLGNGSMLRVASINQKGSLLEIEGFYVYGAASTSAATADGGQQSGATTSATVPSLLYLLDAPLLQNADDQPGVYVAAAGLAGWKSASIWRSRDGVNYINTASLTQPATAGNATTILANGPTNYIDHVSSVTVQLVYGSLASCNDLDLLNGANAAWLGGEIIQFQTATLMGPGQYQLTNLLRGRRGTEYATTTHTVGEDFVLLQSGSLDFLAAQITDRGASYDFRALSKGQSLGDAQDYAFTYALNTIRPFAPAGLSGTRSNGTSGDLTLTWKRRARLNAEWVDNIDVPLDESSESYDLEIMNGTSVMRTFSTITAPTITYTVAQQTADWGGTVPPHFTINVYQLSSRYGRGLKATALV